MTSVAALIVAAGQSIRFGSDLPKQYHDLGGRTVLWRSVHAFLSHRRINRVAVVIDPASRSYYDAAIDGLGGLEAPPAGGASRQESVFRGLKFLGKTGTRPVRVLIHDGARPLVDAATIDRTIDALDSNAAAIVGLPVRDTLKRAAGANGLPIVGGTVDRSGLWRAQTPQGFDFETILTAHGTARQRGDHHAHTDDAALVEAAGVPVALVQGHEDNLKVTTSDDLARARRLIADTVQRSALFRIGKGFDVHRIGPGNAMWICGIEVPAEGSLIGHSDADVGLHAITDAILGAIADGDIGSHFSDEDPRWKGARSDRFLAHAAALVAQRGGRIANVDVTLICERPKIDPHRDAMTARVAEILALAPDAVSVKATTTETLGFTGRGEGIAAEAVACVWLPA